MALKRDFTPNIQALNTQIYCDSKDWLHTGAGWGYYRTSATPLDRLHMRIIRGAAEAHTSCPIEIECTMIRAREANKRLLNLSQLQFLHGSEIRDCDGHHQNLLINRYILIFVLNM